MLSAALEGFKTLEQTNLVVNANDKLSAGMLMLEVGALTESIQVSARSIELQSNSGERSFTMENSTLTNIANNGRMMFNFATLVPGALSQNAGAGTELGSVSGFTVNGQRPNSNNMTIDGVANIDTGDNGGNMATTNIDSVAEFKMLTNSYQAEYGRAVGGQLQVVTKSGTNAFHGSGYWYGRRPSWNANYWTNNRDGLPTPKNTRDDRGYTIGGPILKQKLFFFWSQEFQSRFTPPNIRYATVPTALERQGDFSQSVDSSGTPFPYIRDSTTGLPCSASNTSGCFQDGGVLGRIPANRVSSLGLNMLKLFPQATGSYGGGQNFSSQVADQAPRREDLIRLDYQVSSNWHVTGRFMNTKENLLQAYGTTWAGNGSDQLPTPTLFMHPGKNFMMSTQGVLSSTMSFEASVGTAKNSLNYDLQLDPLRRSNSGLTSFPYLYPDAVQSDYVPWLQFRGGRTGNAGQYQTDRGPFTNENQTWDVVGNLTKVWGAHTSKAGVYYQNSRKPQSIFYSFNGSVNFTNDSSNPFDTGYSYANAATGVFNTYTQANKFSIPNYVYKNLEFYAQDNWKRNRLTLDYGVRFYVLTPQWDTTLQVSNFLPDEFNQAAAAGLYSPVCLTASPCSGADRRGMDPALIAQGVAPTLANTVEGRFIGRLTPGSDRFNGAFQAGQGISDTVQNGNAFRISPRLGAVYDLSGSRDHDHPGRLGHLLRPPAGQHGVRPGRQRAGRPQLHGPVGPARRTSAAERRHRPTRMPTLGLNPTAYDFDPPRVQQWNVGVQRKLAYHLVADFAYVGSHSDHQLRQEQINSIPLGAAFQASNQDPTKAASATPGGSAVPNDLMRPYSGYNNIRMWDYSGYSNYNALQAGVTRRFDKNYMFSAFYVWSKSLTINNDDFTAGWPYTTDDATIRHYDYSYANFDRPHNFVLNAIYQTPHLKDGIAGIFTNDWQISGVYRYTSGRPYGIGYSIPGISNINLTGSDYGARVVVTCNPGSGSSSDPYKQLDTSCFAPPQPGSKGDESARFFLHGPAQNNVDLSLSKQFAVYKEREVRASARRVQRAQPHAVHGRQRDGELREPDRPYDHEPAV